MHFMPMNTTVLFEVYTLSGSYIFFEKTAYINVFCTTPLNSFFLLNYIFRRVRIQNIL